MIKKHQKTVWDRSISYRKKAYFSFMKSGRCWSDSVEWYTWTDWDYLAQQGDKLVWEDIYFPSRRYKKLCYVALLRTVDCTAEDMLENIMADFTAQYLGYKDSKEFYEDNKKSKAQRKKELRMLTKYDKKNDWYIVDPRLFAKTIYPDFGFMSFYELMYAQIWPNIREKIDELLPPIYSNMDVKAGRKRLIITQTFDVHELTITNLDKYVQDFWNRRERIIKAKDETTLCHPDYNIIRQSMDKNSESYIPTKEVIEERKKSFEQSEKEAIS